MSTSILNIWKKVAWLPVGGTTEIGFSQNECFLLVVSWQGRGVIDTTTGQKVARDPEEPRGDCPWLDEKNKSVIGIGPIKGETIQCVGLWGGGLPTHSRSFAVRVSAQAGGEDVTLLNTETNSSEVLQTAITDIRAMGFSPSGDLVVIATSSDVEILRRAE